MAFFGGGAAAMVGATSSAAGTAGLVPAPAAGEQNAVLGGQGTFLPALIRPKLPSTRYYCPIQVGGSTAATLNQNMDTRVYITPPLYLPAISVANLRLRHNSNAGANGTMYVALYNSTSDGLPNSPVITTSHTFTTTQGAINKTMSISPSVAIKAGIYFGACYLDSATSVAILSVGRADASLLGIASADNPLSTANNMTPYFANSKTGGNWEDPAGSLSFTNGNSAYCFYIEVGV